MSDVVDIKTAIVSVSDKTGLDMLAGFFIKRKVKVLSTGGTARALKGLGVDCIEISDYTSQAEIMDGRVKTLHPKVFAGLLCRAGKDLDVKELNAIGAELIDLVVVNLYPFEDACAKGLDEDELIEKVDIGGPSMIRAAAKNWHRVAVLSSPSQYESFIAETEAHKGGTSLNYRKQLAAAVFQRTSAYDSAIAEGLFGVEGQSGPAVKRLEFRLAKGLRYGENPHQKAGFYVYRGEPMPFDVFQGKELSYNNILDLHSVWLMCIFFDKGCFASVVKHNNPCGAALGSDITEAFVRANAADPMSAFGGIIGLNQKVDGKTAKAIIESGFKECVLAPEYDEEALSVFSAKPNIRVVRYKRDIVPHSTIKEAFNGCLIQDVDLDKDDEKGFSIAAGKEPDEGQWRDLLFSWSIARFVRSNAIVAVKDGATVGIGAGQMSRVDAVDIAIRKAQDRIRGAVMASDGFLPHIDNVELMAKAGVAACIQPGGSRVDNDVIEAAKRYNITMVMTGRRHFRH